MTDKTHPEYAALLLRLTLGVAFLAHGALKIFVFGIDGTVGFFQSIGYPAAFAYLTIAAEVAGGALLILGLYTRWVSLALIPVLIGAAQFHWGNGWVFSAQGGGWEYPAFWTMMMGVQALAGDGAHALGSIMSRRGDKAVAA